jgi:hypothetical protein
MRAVLVAVAVVGIVFGAACGSSSTTSESSGEAKPYVDALIKAMTHSESDSGPPLTKSEARCLAPKVVDEVGVAAIKKAGATPSQFADADSMSDVKIEVDDDASSKLADDFTDCLDDPAFAASFSQAFGLDEVPNACGDFFDIETWAEPMVKAFIGPSDKSDKAFNDVMVSAPGACAEVMLLQGLSQAGDIKTAQIDCVASKLDDADAKVMWQARIASNAGTSTAPDAARRLQAAVDACA